MMGQLRKVGKTNRRPISGTASSAIDDANDAETLKRYITRGLYFTVYVPVKFIAQ